MRSTGADHSITSRIGERPYFWRVLDSVRADVAVRRLAPPAANMALKLEETGPTMKTFWRELRGAAEGTLRGNYR